MCCLSVPALARHDENEETEEAHESRTDKDKVICAVFFSNNKLTVTCKDRLSISARKELEGSFDFST